MKALRDALVLLGVLGTCAGGGAILAMMAWTSLHMLAGH